MRVLVVGAGAIGQVFGRHLQLGGAEVSFLVRPRYADAARAGFDMYPLNRPAGQRGVPVRLEGFGVLTDQAEALAQEWDLVVLCVSSVALRSGNWLAELVAGMGSAALLALQPGPEDPDVVFAHADRSRTAWGMLSVCSYQAPLPVETLPTPGVAYWFPWASPLGFSGAADVVDLVTATLSAGGMPVAKIADVQAEVAFVGAVLDKVIVALECAGWSFRALRADRALLATAHRAMQESWALAEATTGAPTPRTLRLLGPGVLRVALLLAPKVLPFDLEAFFRFHYAKVAEQTVMLLDTQIAGSKARNVPCPATAELTARVRQLRADQSQ